MSSAASITERSMLFLSDLLDFLRRETEDGYKLPPLQIIQQHVRGQFIRPDGTWDIEEFNWRYNVLEYAFLMHNQYACHSTHFHTSFFSFVACYNTTYNETEEMLVNTMQLLRARV